MKPIVVALWMIYKVKQPEEFELGEVNRSLFSRYISMQIKYAVRSSQSPGSIIRSNIIAVPFQQYSINDRIALDLYAKSHDASTSLKLECHFVLEFPSCHDN